MQLLVAIASADRLFDLARYCLCHPDLCRHHHLFLCRSGLSLRRRICSCNNLLSPSDEPLSGESESAIVNTYYRCFVLWPTGSAWRGQFCSGALQWGRERQCCHSEQRLSPDAHCRICSARLCWRPAALQSLWPAPPMTSPSIRCLTHQEWLLAPTVTCKERLRMGHFALSGPQST